MTLCCFLLASSCARNPASVTVHDAPNPGDAELARRLSSVPMSANLSLSAASRECDEAAAVRAFQRRFHASLGAVNETWSACQDLYACSPTTWSKLKDWFGSGATFRVGFTDVPSLGISGPGRPTSGIYLSGSRDIFLDTTIKGMLVACTVLLHELTHRFDPAAERGEESLRTEYRAYWRQLAFRDELLLDRGALGEHLRTHVSGRGEPDPESSEPNALSFHTRESLLSSVAKSYGFPLELSVAEELPKLPMERAGRN